MGEDTLSVAGSLSTAELEEKPKVVFKEMHLMTPGERAARDALRLAMSQCCLREAWGVYRRLTFAGYTADPRDPDPRPASVLYDPEFDRRKLFLGRKYRSLLDGYYKLKEAPSLPYIRPGPPRLLDVPGRQAWMPPPARRQMPQHEPDYSLPESISGKCTIVRVFSTMFMDEENTKEQSTQTWRRDFTELAKKWAKCRDWVDTRPNVKMEHFDIEDIPLDAKGYPIGKSVGICEWCKQDVLPIPSRYTLRRTWDKTKLYCCAKYREFVQGAQDIEQKLMAEYDLKNRRIDIRPDRNKKVTKKKTSSSANESSSLEGTTDEDRRAAMTAKVARIKERDAAEREVKRAKKDQERLDYLSTLRDKMADTFDLPWDPYESKFKHGRVFNDQIFDDSAFHFYDHAEVVMTQSGLFDQDDDGSEGQSDSKSKQQDATSSHKSSNQSDTNKESQEGKDTGSKQSERKSYKSVNSDGSKSQSSLDSIKKPLESQRKPMNKTSNQDQSAKQSEN